MLTTPEQPLVSIIIRSMDRSTLAEALDSVCGQTYPNIEIIVVNAKGGDHTDPASSCSRFPLQLINQGGKPMGRSAAANAGLEAAQGNLLGFLDDDDLLRPEHVARLVAALDTHPTAVAAYSRVHALDFNGNLLREFSTPFDAVSLHLANFLPIHAVLFRRQAYTTGARFDEALDLCEDWDFWIQIAQQGNFIFVDAMTAVYRIGRGSGFAIMGDPELARAAEQAVCAKWQTRMNADLFYEVVNRARTFPKLQEAQAHNNHLQFEVKDLKRMLTDSNRMLSEANQAQSELRRLHEDTIAMYENSRSWLITSPLRKISTQVYLAKRAWLGFGLLDWHARLRVLGWLMSGQIAPARRKLSLAAQATEVSHQSTLPATVAPRMHENQPSFPALPERIDVLIPIYNGFEFLAPLFDSLECAHSTPFRLLVCDDASTDERVQPWLEQRLQDFPDAILLCNENNLGFVGTVNRLFAQVMNDFVLLNSDVQVPPFWLERLFAPMLARSYSTTQGFFVSDGTGKASRPPRSSDY